VDQNLAIREAAIRHCRLLALKWGCCFAGAGSTAQPEWDRFLARAKDDATHAGVLVLRADPDFWNEAPEHVFNSDLTGGTYNENPLVHAAAVSGPGQLLGHIQPS
jgi:hypothetical protein